MKRKAWILAGAAVLLLLLLALLLVGLPAKRRMDWNRQYDLGVRCLNEARYSEALLAFTGAIQIDARRPEAYLGAADACLGLSDTGGARDFLEQGLQNCGEDDSLQQRLEELENSDLSSETEDTPLSPAGTIQVISRNSEGEPLSGEERIYDETGRQTGLVLLDGAGEETARLDFLYDEQGRCTQSGEVSEVTGELLRRVSVYGDGEQPERQELYQQDGSLLEQILFQYDEQGNLVREERQSAQGQTTSVQVYEWQQGRLTTKINYGSGGICTGSVQYSYNEDGFLIREDRLSGAGGPLGGTLYERNADGLCLKMTYLDPGGAATLWVESEYDETGMLLRETMQMPDGQLVWTKEYSRQP